MGETSGPVTALIAFGGNLPWRDIAPEALMPKMLDALDAPDLRIVARSSLWRTPAWPDPSGPEYVNGAARIDTSLSPGDLLDRLHGTERSFGRQRDGDRNQSRTLDLDIIDYGGRVVTNERLSLPHPRASQRAFVLLPLREVVPDWRDPVSGQGIDALIAALPAEDVGACVRIG